MNIEKLGLSSIFASFRSSAASNTSLNPDNSTLFDDSTTTKDEDGDIVISSGKSEEGSSYNNAITMVQGTQTQYSTEINGKVYYFNSPLEKSMAMLLEDQGTAAAGIGTIPEDYGQESQYYTTSNGYRYYFSSYIDVIRSKFMTDDAIKEAAIGRQSIEFKGGSDIKSNADAVEMKNDEKTEFYIDHDGIRYYYTPENFAKAQTSNNPSQYSCGQARVMTEWGSQTEYYIDYDGSRYYFNNENDKSAAQKKLDENDGKLSMTGALTFNKYVVGRS